MLFSKLDQLIKRNQQGAFKSIYQMSYEERSGDTFFINKSQT